MENLDFHCQLILEEYRESLPALKRMKEVVTRALHEALERNGLIVTAVEARVKTEESLAGKLALKGAKYATLSDITDILGARIITFYTDDVDRIAAMAEQLFDIDWDNSVDKRRLHQLDSFGYNSLHYICRLPKTLCFDPQFPQLNDIRFELQLRTTLQHAWAAINHDTGYKSGVEIPREYMRRMNRLAGMLEMADDEFSRIRTEITDYRRRVQQLVQNGKLDDVALPLSTKRRYRKHPSSATCAYSSPWTARRWVTCSASSANTKMTHTSLPATSWVTPTSTSSPPPSGCRTYASSASSPMAAAR